MPHICNMVCDLVAVGWLKLDIYPCLLNGIYHIRHDCNYISTLTYGTAPQLGALPHTFTYVVY